jgi:hypothetical protein
MIKFKEWISSKSPLNINEKYNINFEKDYSLLPCFYPLYVLVVNRIIDSPISRQS